MNFVFTKYFKKKSLRGFSLGEVLLAGFVLTVGLLVISALMGKSLKNSFETRDTIVAVLLAQEGVELVRNVRDNNFAQDGTGFAAFDSSKKHCRIDYNDVFAYPDAGTVTPKLDCTASQGSPSRYTLQYISGFYQHNNTSPERFSRYIYIKDNTNGSAINYLVRSFVYWGGALIPSSPENTTGCSIAKKCVFTEINLTNWK